MSALDDDVARMTKGLFDNAKDVFDIWMFQPHRHGEFGVQEIQDIRDVIHGLTAVLKAHDKPSNLKVAAR